MTSEQANKLIVEEIQSLLKLMKNCPEAITPPVLEALLGQLAINSFTFGMQVGITSGFNAGTYHAANTFSKN